MQQELPGLDMQANGEPSAESQTSDQAIVLTPNQSLAQQLRRKRLTYLNTQAAPSGNIKVLSAWLIESLTENAEKPFANDMQLQLLWQQALEINQHRFPDLNPKTLAPQALVAWRNLRRYEVSMPELKSAEIGQLIRFSDAVTDFESLLEKSSFTTVELEIARQLELSITQPSPTLTARCELYAFVETLPELILRWITRCFDQIDAKPYQAVESSAKLYSATDEQTELKATSAWANEVLQRDRDAKIGILYSSLSSGFNRSVRLIESSLTKQTTVSASLLPPLSDTAAIRTAQHLLSMNLREIDISLARAITQSRFWSNFDAEYIDRCQWDIDLCEMRIRQLKPDQIREKLIDRVQNENSLDLTQRLNAFFESRRRKPNTASLLDWADLFQQQLNILGWPGALLADLDESTQLTDEWFDALRDFSALGAVSGKVDIATALSLLGRACDGLRTAPGAAHRGVRIIDTIEGAADFTHLWITGVDHTQWPAGAAPNPLLPVSLQRKHGMPHASAEQETVLAEILIQRALTSATEVVFSFAETAEGIAQSPSGLLPELPPLILAAQIDSGVTTASNTQTAASAIDPDDFEFIDTRYAPELSDAEHSVAGGASLLKTMSASPFDAFAQWRLGAYELQTPKVGLDAAERGTLVHEVLDALSKTINSSTRLAALSPTERIDLCDQVSQSTLQRWQGRRTWLNPAYAELEMQRLSSLVQKWLDVESDRPTFEILQAEERLFADLAGLTFNLRLDRLDKLSNGSLLLIDYKTGKSISTKNWLEMPPAEPQLPLYAISLDSAPDAICFAQVRPDSVRMIGIGSNTSEQGKRPQDFKEIENWEHLLIQWRESLTELAEQYSKGLAEVRFKAPDFSRKDPLAPLHRSNEYDALMDFRATQSTIRKADS